METQPQFLSREQVLELHRRTIARHGGDPSVRDLGMLDSAIAQPRASFGGAFLHATIADMAAAYLFHLATNHPFVDGNKRTGALAALTFLALNDRRLDIDEARMEQFVLSVARGEADKSTVAEFFRRELQAFGAKT